MDIILEICGHKTLRETPKSQSSISMTAKSKCLTLKISILLFTSVKVMRLRMANSLLRCQLIKIPGLCWTSTIERTTRDLNNRRRSTLVTNFTGSHWTLKMRLSMSKSSTHSSMETLIFVRSIKLWQVRLLLSTHTLFTCMPHKIWMRLTTGPSKSLTLNLVMLLLFGLPLVSSPKSLNSSRTLMERKKMMASFWWLPTTSLRKNQVCMLLMPRR